MSVAGDSTARIPNLFVVGAPKAGTTAMHAYLAKHPDVFMSRVKEPTWFGSDLPGERYCRDLAEYLELFEAARDERWIGEASPWYLISHTAAREIHDFSPDARIVAMLRDPVALIESLHASALFSGDEDVTDIRRALELEPARRSGQALAPLSKLPQATFYRAIVDFVPQLERYLEVFGRGRVHVIVFDDLARDPAATYRAVLEFLGIDPSFRPRLEVVNPNRVVRSSALRRFYLEPPPRARAVLKRLVPRPLIRRVWTQGLWPLLYQANTRHAARRPMPVDLRAALRAETRPSVRQLSGLLGRDLEALWSP